MNPQAHAPAALRVLADADLCVKCGLCLPHCPTYLDTQHEGDSPRGRIALVQGLASGWIEPSERVETHLDGCLSCRRCEVVCPARVPYSRILDAGREQLVHARPARAALPRLLAAMLISPPVRAVLRWLFRVNRALGVTPWLAARTRRRWPRLGRLVSFAPMTAAEPAVAEPVPQAGGDPIALFHGCATDLFEREAIHATQVLLTAAGYAVHAPSTQACCGALHQHAGRRGQAEHLARRNLAAFQGQQRVATLTTGCAATLRDYAGFALQGGAEFAGHVQEFSDWLLPRADRLAFRPLPQRAALHVPCTASNVLKSDAALRTLLARIPGLDVVELDPVVRCCGAAGSHFLTHPAEADRFLQPKLDAVQRLQPDFIISGNVGCSLHLAAGLSRLGSRAVPVRHPAQVLAAQLVRPPSRS